MITSNSKRPKPAKAEAIKTDQEQQGSSRVSIPDGHTRRGPETQKPKLANLASEEEEEERKGLDLEEIRIKAQRLWKREHDASYIPTSVEDAQGEKQKGIDYKWDDDRLNEILKKQQQRQKPKKEIIIERSPEKIKFNQMLRSPNLPA